MNTIRFIALLCLLLMGFERFTYSFSSLGSGKEFYQGLLCFIVFVMFYGRHRDNAGE